MALSAECGSPPRRLWDEEEVARAAAWPLRLRRLHKLTISLALWLDCWLWT